MIALAMPLWSRPDYTWQALDALRTCRGIADCVLFPTVEPGCDEVRALVEAVNFVECRPVFNRERLGCNANTRLAWSRGFDAADYTVLIEEDVVLAPDALEFHQWARDRYRGDRGVLSVTAYHRRQEECPPELLHSVSRRPWFHGWGAGLWADRWPLVRDCFGGGSWDEAVMNRGAGGGLVEVFPLLSRCQNVGLVTSVQQGAQFTPEWYAENHRLKHWAGDIDVGKGVWRESDQPAR